MRTVFITGANRGIGLALAKHYLSHGDTVIAGVRKAANLESLSKLEGAERLEITELEITSSTDIEALRVSLGTRPIHILINNAAVPGPIDEWAKGFDTTEWLRTYEIDAIGPLLVTLGLRDNLKAAAGKVIAITSALGSIERVNEMSAATGNAGGFLAYRMAKAALNMAMRILALELKSDGVTTALVAPGWVRTDTTGPEAPLSPDESAAGIAQTIDSLTLETTGVFKNYTGESMPW